MLGQHWQVWVTRPPCITCRKSVVFPRLLARLQSVLVTFPPKSQITPIQHGVKALGWCTTSRTRALPCIGRLGRHCSHPRRGIPAVPGSLLDVLTFLTRISTSFRWEVRFLAGTTIRLSQLISRVDRLTRTYSAWYRNTLTQQVTSTLHIACSCGGRISGLQAA